MRSIVVTILKGVGVKRVREVSSGAEALTALREFPADLAIVDFNMQPLDGVEFTKLVRNAKDSPNAYLPIIMMTGHAERSKVMMARNSGVTEFVVKPVTARSILGRIQAVIFKPRPFVRTDSYFGPCRRRVKDERYNGPMRRQGDPPSSDTQAGDASLAVDAPGAASKVA
jgi:DNA-binding response OmpR family regulator